VKITFEKIADGEEDEIIVRSSSKNPELMRVLALLESQDVILTAYSNGGIFRIRPEDVFYVEAIDRAVFLHCESEVYEAKYKLHELEKMLAAYDFFRISKSMLVNLLQIKSFTFVAKGRLEAVMKSGEKVPISRHYMAALKNLLDL